MPDRPKWLDELEALAEALEHGDPLPESLLDDDSESWDERLWRTVREGEANYG